MINVKLNDTQIRYIWFVHDIRYRMSYNIAELPAYEYLVYLQRHPFQTGKFEHKHINEVVVLYQI